MITLIFDLIESKLKLLVFLIAINYIVELFNFFTKIDFKKNDELNESK